MFTHSQILRIMFAIKMVWALSIYRGCWNQKKITTNTTLAIYSIDFCVITHLFLSASVFKKGPSVGIVMKLSLLPSISVPARHSAVLSPQRVSLTMWSSLRVTTLWCTTRSTLWADGPSSSEPTWTTASRRSRWTESAPPMDSMMSCLLAQVNDLTLNFISKHENDV